MSDGPTPKASILHGDCRDVLPTLAEASIDSVVCDPPYDLTAASRRGSPRTNDPESPFGRHRLQSAGGFMGQRWDATGVAFDPDTWRAVLRVLKPGGHLLAFGGTRTYHRMACAVEDAGFEIRDQIQWIYASGFPKSHNLDDEWDGWGTALKPAHEPIVVGRKPLAGTVAENMGMYATGALNIAGCRVPSDGGRRREGEDSQGRRYADRGSCDFAALPGPRGGDPAGRWPANVIHDGSEEVRASFPEAPGQQATVTGREPTANGFSGAVKYSGMVGRVASDAPRIETDRSAARFFYCAKAGRREREAGLDGLPTRPGGMRSETSGQHLTRRDGNDPAPVRNHHPTVKPVELMRYLCRLVTPANGTILDPFAGSGTTGVAATLEGFRFIGIEKEPEYVEIARRRIVLPPSEEERPVEDAGPQFGLFP